MAHVDSVVIHEVMETVSVCSVSSSLKAGGVRAGKDQGSGGWTNLAETDGGGLFTETLAAEVKTIFADDTSLVGAQTAGEASIRILPEVSEQEYQLSHHWREPFPYFLGRENQTASCVMVRWLAEKLSQEFAWVRWCASVGKAYGRLYSCLLWCRTAGSGELDRRRLGRVQVTLDSAAGTP